MAVIGSATVAGSGRADGTAALHPVGRPRTTGDQVQADRGEREPGRQYEAVSGPHAGHYDRHRQRQQYPAEPAGPGGSCLDVRILRSTAGAGGTGSRTMTVHDSSVAVRRPYGEVRHQTRSAAPDADGRQADQARQARYTTADRPSPYGSRARLPTSGNEPRK
ncbi:hypothetical protein GCM10027615_38620 [Plantactinospora veratri]